MIVAADGRSMSTSRTSFVEHESQSQVVPLVMAAASGVTGALQDANGQTAAQLAAEQEAAAEAEREAALRYNN